MRAAGVANQYHTDARPPDRSQFYPVRALELACESVLDRCVLRGRRSCGISFCPDNRRVMATIVQPEGQDARPRSEQGRNPRA
jgi:hypothetical protein